MQMNSTDRPLCLWFCIFSSISSPIRAKVNFMLFAVAYELFREQKEQHVANECFFEGSQNIHIQHLSFESQPERRVHSLRIRWLHRWPSNMKFGTEECNQIFLFFGFSFNTKHSTDFFLLWFAGVAQNKAHSVSVPSPPYNLVVTQFMFCG